MSACTGSAPDAERPADWRQAAACRHSDPDLFDASPTIANRYLIEEAKSICYRCPVLEQCGQWALETRQPVGTWGGLDESEPRYILRRRGIRLPDLDEEPPPPRTFQSLYDERTVPLHDGHLGWTGAVPVHCDGAYHTPTKISFRVDRGRDAVGTVRRTCDRLGCILPAHLMDQQERDERACGSRSSYRRHLRDGEEPWGPCRQASSDRDLRVRRAGTKQVTV